MRDADCEELEAIDPTAMTSIFRIGPLLLLAASLQVAPLHAAPRPAVARIVVQERGAVAYGSGTLVDRRDRYGLVVTNWHVVRDATGKIEVVFPDGFRSEARAVKLDEDWDLAALVVWRPPVEPMPMARRAPRPGEALTICGYGQGDYREATGRCTDFYAPELGMPHELVELSVEARQGDSGGPILNSSGEIAGVLFGAGQGTTLGSFGPRVENFLATLAPDIGRARSPGMLPSTPVLVAHAPPAERDSWQSLTAPEELADAPIDSTNCEPWPTNIASKDAGQRKSPTTGDNGFSPWNDEDDKDAKEVEPEAPVVASIQGPPVEPYALGPPEWFDPARNALAVIGVVFLFLQLARAVS